MSPMASRSTNSTPTLMVSSVTPGAGPLGNVCGVDPPSAVVSSEAVSSVSPAVQPTRRTAATARVISGWRSRIERHSHRSQTIVQTFAPVRYGEGIVLDPDRLLPPDPGVRRLAHGLY